MVQSKYGTFPLQCITAFVSSPFIINMNCFSGHHTVSCKNTNLDLYWTAKNSVMWCSQNMVLFHYNVLPLVRNTCNSFDHIKNLHRGIPKPEKTTQAPLVYINAHSCIYNKCLIVISHRDTIERRGAKKKVRFGVPV